MKIKTMNRHEHEKDNTKTRDHEPPWTIKNMKHNLHMITPWTNISKKNHEQPAFKK